MANKIVPQTLNSSGVYDKLITAISSGGTGAESESAAVKNLISGLTSTSPASDDLIPFQDVSSGSAGKTTLSALASALQSVRGYAKIQTGSYVGTGTYGESNPCSLTFDFVPSVIMVSGRGHYEESQNTIVAVNKSPLSTIITVQYPFSVNVNFNGNQVSWYTTANNPAYQANERNSTYAYAAIG